MSETLAVRAARIPTTVLADLTADAGHPKRVLSPSIQAFDTAIERIAGPAYTVVGGRATPDESGPDLLKAQVIDQMPPGAVAVWAGGQTPGICLFGDMLAAGMKARGVLGAVLDGGIRDLDDIASMGFPVLARYRTPQASSGLWRVRAAQVPVELPGALDASVRVEPGDLIVADVNGAIAIPAAIAEEVVTAGEKYLAREDEIRGRIRAGDSLAALVGEYGRL